VRLKKDCTHCFNPCMKTQQFFFIICTTGQGIWYNVPEAPDVTLKKSAPIADHRSAPTPNTVFNRSQLSLPEDAFLYFCPQSVFKMHPHFDYVIADILLANPLGHVVITGGRRPLWTTTYMARLKAALGVELMQRLHLIERVSSENFLALLDITDAMLHPFPFDGSRT
jgi:protein O-GlcNAc transferase